MGKYPSVRYGGRQPFATILLAQGRKIGPTGVFLGFDYFYTLGVASGRRPLSEDFKEAIEELLGLPEEELFTKELLRSRYNVRQNAKGFRKTAETRDE